LLGMFAPKHGNTWRDFLYASTMKNPFLLLAAMPAHRAVASCNRPQPPPPKPARCAPHRDRGRPLRQPDSPAISLAQDRTHAFPVTDSLSPTGTASNVSSLHHRATVETRPPRQGGPPPRIQNLIPNRPPTKGLTGTASDDSFMHSGLALSSALDTRFAGHTMLVAIDRIEAHPLDMARYHFGQNPQHE